MLVECFCRLQLQGKMDDLHDIVADQVKFVDIVGPDLVNHLPVYGSYIIVLLLIQHIKWFIAWLEHGHFLEAAPHMTGKESVFKDAEITGGIFAEGLEGIGNIGVEEDQGGAGYFQAFVGIMVGMVPAEQGHLVEVAATILHRGFAGTCTVFQPEHVEMPDILFQVVRQPVEFLPVEILDGLRFCHNASNYIQRIPKDTGLLGGFS